MIDQFGSWENITSFSFATNQLKQFNQRLEEQYKQNMIVGTDPFLPKKQVILQKKKKKQIVQKEYYFPKKYSDGSAQRHFPNFYYEYGLDQQFDKQQEKQIKTFKLIKQQNLFSENQEKTEKKSPRFISKQNNFDERLPAVKQTNTDTLPSYYSRKNSINPRILRGTDHSYRYYQSPRILSRYQKQQELAQLSTRISKSITTIMQSYK